MADRATVPHDIGGDDLDADALAGDRATTVRPADGLPDTVAVPVRSLLWRARIGVAVGALGLILAAVFFLGAQDLRREAAVREDVREAGELVALRVTTFEGSDIDDWVTDTQSLSTGDYAREVAERFDPAIRQGLADAQVQSVGTVLSAFVQDVRDETATVFAVMRQTYTSALQPQQVSDELRMEIELTLVEGEWLASDVAVLGPSTITPIDQDAAGPSGDPEPEEG
ncbi:hypothetical protein [Euzebya rosea]|uniref:hypothetical protein n=1 Tax=Euzebya rosea TaxID=2052804 RepID=UPI000D3E6DCD|nr:hypothetical protein [Euzebya rosea]